MTLSLEFRLTNCRAGIACNIHSNCTRQGAGNSACFSFFANVSFSFHRKKEKEMLNKSSSFFLLCCSAKKKKRGLVEFNITEDFSGRCFVFIIQLYICRYCQFYRRRDVFRPQRRHCSIYTAVNINTLDRTIKKSFSALLRTHHLPLKRFFNKLRLLF